MPLQSKVQVRALVRELIDDPGGRLWNTTNLDMLIEGCLDELWGQLLDQFGYLRSTSQSLTPTSPGYIDLSTANTAFTSRFYRVQKVVRDGVEFSPVSNRDVLMQGTTALDAPDSSYTIFDNKLWLFPQSTTAVYMQYASLPEPFTSLSPGPDPDDSADDDVSFVEWPDGHHMAYIYDVASKAIEKGDREESAKLARRFEVSWLRLLSYLRKQNAGITMAQIHDQPEQWC